MSRKSNRLVKKIVFVYVALLGLEVGKVDSPPSWNYS